MNESKILIDGAIFQMMEGRPSGISRVWETHLDYLSNTDLAAEVILLDRGNTAPDFSGISRRVIERYDPFLFEGDPLYLQEIMDQEDADLLISTYFTYPEHSPSLIMLHDMTPEIMGLDLNHPEWRAKAQAVRKASGYFSVSHSTKDDFQKLYPQQKHKPITVVPNAASGTFREQSPEDIQDFRQRHDLQKPYFFLVGRRDGYKNAQIFFRAFALFTEPSDYEILCAGGNPQLERNFRSFLGGARCQVKRFSDQDLALAYAGAVCLIYPSLYEGFGLPILEAQQSRCPVITYDRSSLKEVGGDGALYPEPHDAASLHAALQQVQQPEVRRPLVQAGVENARRFSWVDSSQRLLQGVQAFLDRLPSIPRNQPDPLTSGVRFAYLLSRSPTTRQLGEAMLGSARIIILRGRSLDFEQLSAYEAQIRTLIQPDTIRKLQEIQSRPGSDGLINYWLGLGYLSEGHENQALHTLVKGIQKNLNSARVNQLAAELAGQQGEWNLAHELWKTLASNFPGYDRAQHMLLKAAREISSPGPETKGTHGQQPAPEKTLQAILDAPDISQALEAHHRQFSPELVQLTQKNASQARMEGMEELAEGLDSLAELIQASLNQFPRSP